MNLAIMQPYLFPYLGYWQLMNAVDSFVILDDVNYIKRGYINRNNVLIDNKAHLFTIPLNSPSQYKLIMDTKLKFNNDEKNKFLRTLFLAYKRAPYFESVYPLLEKIIKYEEDDITAYIENSFFEITAYLDMNVNFERSSQIEKNNLLKGEERIIEICKQKGADVYINPIGGIELYHTEIFAEQGIELKFIKMNKENVAYKQFNDSFVENLSIIDVLMFNSKEDVKRLLGQYDLMVQ